MPSPLADPRILSVYPVSVPGVPGPACQIIFHPATPPALVESAASATLHTHKRHLREVISSRMFDGAADLRTFTTTPDPSHA